MSQHDAPGVIMEEQQAPSGGAPKAAPKSRAVWIAVAVIVVIVVVVLAAVLGGLFAPAAPAHLRIGTLLSIVGAQFSGGSLSVVPIATANGVVMVSPSATSVLLSNLTITGGWFFRTIS